VEARSRVCAGCQGRESSEVHRCPARTGERSEPGARRRRATPRSKTSDPEEQNARASLLRPATEEASDPEEAKRACFAFAPRYQEPERISKIRPFLCHRDEEAQAKAERARFCPQGGGGPLPRLRGMPGPRSSEVHRCPARTGERPRGAKRACFAFAPRYQEPERISKIRPFLCHRDEAAQAKAERARFCPQGWWRPAPACARDARAEIQRSHVPRAPESAASREHGVDERPRGAKRARFAFAPRYR